MFILYAIILILGFFTSYTDIKFKKIRNIHLAFASAFGLATYAHLFSTQQMVFSTDLMWNLLVGIGIGLILYFTDTWGAGDAKLFAVLCLLMPTEKYSSIFFFPAIAIFTNIFLVSTLAILILSIKQMLKNKTNILKKIFSLSTLTMLGGAFLTIFSLKWIITAFIKFLIPQATIFISMLALFFLFRLLRLIIKKFKNNFIVFLIFGVGLISQFLLHPEAFEIANLLPHLKRTVSYTLIFYILSTILNLNNTDDKNEKIIPFAPFMILGTLLINTNFMNWIMQTLKAIGK